MAKPLYAVLVLMSSLLTGLGFAQTPTLRVLPWNGHSAAVSLTFDDARPVHLDVVVPELNKRHLNATFFVIVSKLTRLDDWRRAQAQGHEIGNHSVTHQHPAELNQGSEELEVEDAKKFLDSNFKSDVTIFAYPYCELSSGLLFWVKRYDFAARGWQGDGESAYVTSDTQPDWYNLPSQPAYTRYDATVYRSWIDKAFAMHAWTTLQIHGIGDPSTGFEPIPVDTFRSLLDDLKAQESRGLWVAPFGTVAAYLRAQKTLEAAKPQLQNGGERFVWKVPEQFPPGVALKTAIEGGTHLHVYQGKRELIPSKGGVYSVSFDSEELVVTGAL
ncbi:MAG TPA: polysaccharide deacetylase family protein [Candidatus Sulfotelmatobacter sp.]